MMKGSKRGSPWRLASVVMLGACLVGCVTPGMREVDAVDSSATTVTFLYSQHTGEESERGVISCELEEDRLSDCTIVDVEYK